MAVDEETGEDCLVPNEKACHHKYTECHILADKRFKEANIFWCPRCNGQFFGEEVLTIKKGGKEREKIIPKFNGGIVNVRMKGCDGVVSFACDNYDCRAGKRMITDGKFGIYNNPHPWCYHKIKMFNILRLHYHVKDRPKIKERFPFRKKEEKKDG
jgi:hypothetical protein